jgi:signal transduction histidine kinase/CheY-like chemotaxis protein
LIDARSGPVLGAAALFLAAYASGKIGVELSRLSGNVAAIWFANAIPLAVMLLRPRREWPAYAVAALAANLSMNLLHGDGLPVSLAFAAANSVEIVGTAILLDRLNAVDIFASWRSMLWFCGIGVAAATGATAAVGAAIVSTQFGAAYPTVFSTWWLADACGMLIVTSAIFAGARIEWRRTLPPRPALELAAAVAATAALAALGFAGRAELPRLEQVATVLLVPCLIWAAVRFCIGCVALANIAMAAAGLGAVVLQDGPELAQALHSAQLRLLIVGATALTLAIMLARLKQQEQQLLVQQEHLTKALSELAVERDRAQAANVAKSNFLATMSHEIRTPMNGVIGYANMLLESPLTPAQRRQAKVVRDCGRALLTVINDILDFSRVEAGKLILESTPFEPAALVRSAAAILQPTAVAKQLRLDVSIADDAPAWLQGDPGRITQIILNLAGNAVKFTERGSVVISLRGGGAAGGRAAIHVDIEDTGIGIPVQSQARLFTDFFQAEGGRWRRFGGTGLGLAICKRLVDLMHGEIGVDSRPGEGSRFWFRVELPIADPTATATASNGDAAGMPTGGRVLVVDDVAINRDLVASLLETAGFTVATAATATAALALFEAQAFDLILMDVEMPDMDGYEATARIRAMPLPKRMVPIVAMTAHVLPGDIARATRVGMNDHIAKPILKDQLLRTTRRWVGAVAWSTDAAEPAAPATAELLSARVLEGLEATIGREKLVDIVGQLIDFIATSAPKVASLREAQQWDELRRETHRLISATGNMGLGRLSALFGRIERAATEPSDDGAAGELSKLVDNVPAVATQSIEALRALFPECGRRPCDPLKAA